MSEGKIASLVILDEGLDPDAQVRVLRKNRDQFFLDLSEAVAA
jgi:hypothetical protein